MKVLVINSGSSSLKFELIDMTKEETLAKGICERIGINDSKLVYKNIVKDTKDEITKDMPNHKVAIDLVLKALQDSENGNITDVNEIDAIGHRVVHGGEFFKSSAVITDEALKKIEEVAELAPLHNPANIMGIKVMQELLPGKPNVAVFDTAFHQTMPAEAYMYALPYEDYTELKVRKYGFHGTSHKYVSEKTAELIDNKNSKIIVCHLGNGASISAVKNGESIDTSMGLTPLQGLMMGTRCGDIDPAAVLYIMEKRGMDTKQMDTRMNKQSGVLGVFGQSSDFRDLENANALGDERAYLAHHMFTYRVKSYIGAYTAALNGVDAIAFTGGVGENDSAVRRDICNGLKYLGVELNEEINNKRISGDVELSTAASKVRIFKIETAEELMIARDTYKLAK
jgi:acetate kinase